MFFPDATRWQQYLFSPFSGGYDIFSGNGHMKQNPEFGFAEFDLRVHNSGFRFGCLYGKRSFSATTSCVSPTRVDTERLAERETLLHRLGSKLNHIV